MLTRRSPAGAPARREGVAPGDGPPFAAMPDMRGMFIVNIVAGAVGTLLAVLLLVAGIGMIRSRPWSRTLHIRWAWIKIVTAIAIAAVTAVMTKRMFDSMFDAMDTGAQTPMPFGSAFGTFAAVAGTVVNLVFILAYPVVVLFLMRNARLKDWLSTR